MKRVVLLAMCWTLCWIFPLSGQEVTPTPEQQADTARARDSAYVLPTLEAQAGRVAEQSRSTVVLTEQAMRGHFAANLNDYFLAGIPGISTSRRSNFGFSGPGAGFSIRGLSNPDVAVFVDGIPNQVNNHFHPRTDQYSPDLIDRVEITRGPSAVLHGASAVGGVVEIFTRTPDEGLSGYAQGELGELNTHEAEGDVAYGWGSGSALFSFTDRASDAQTIGEQFDLRNLNFKVTQQWHPDWSVGFRVANAKEDPGSKFGSNPDETFFRFTEDITSYVLSVRRNTASANGVFALHFNDIQAGSFRESIAKGRFGESEAQQKEQGLYAKHTWLRSDRSTVSLGAEAVRYTDEQPRGADELDENYVSPFAYLTQAIGSRIVLDGGARFTYSGQFGTDLSPELGVVGKIDPTLSARLRGGKAFRVPRVSEVHGAILAEDLNPENFYHAEAGLNKRFGSRVTFDAAFWVMRGTNLIQTIGTGAAAQSVNTGRFTHHGIETSVNIGLTHDLALLVGGGLLDLSQGTRFVPQRTVDLGVDFRRGPFRGTFIARYAGANTTPELNDYFVGDVRLSYTLLERVSLMLDVVNFTDETYATITGFDGPIQQVPRTFLGGIRWNWGDR